jgi:putative ABC transport system permease protein
MAAEPAIEIQQLIELIRPALSVMKSMAVLVIIIAGLSMFIAMFNSLKDRKYEIALLRISGASSFQVFSTIITEGLMISFIGFILGTGLSHVGMEMFSGYLSQNYHYDFTGWIWLDVEWYILLGSFLIGMISALYPAIKAYQIDISETLSKN